MSAINWTEEVAKRKDDLIRDTQQFYKLKVCMGRRIGERGRTIR